MITLIIDDYGSTAFINKIESRDELYALAEKEPNTVHQIMFTHQGYRVNDISGVIKTKYAPTFFVRETNEGDRNGRFICIKNLSNYDKQFIDTIGKQWLKDGKRHRLDGPALESKTRQEWHVNGNLHREDGPAIINHHFYEGEDTPAITFYEYYIDGNLHREDGPAIEDTKGNFQYYKNGLRHREDGPAEYEVYDDEEEFDPDDVISKTNYYQNDVLHRLDGPACTTKFVDGTTQYEFHIDGIEYESDFCLEFKVAVEQYNSTH